MAVNPSFASNAVRTQVVQISIANTNRDGTGAIEVAFLTGASGSRVERLTIQATNTTVSGMIRFFIRIGANIRLWKEYQVTAITPTTTTLAFTLTVNNVALLLATGADLMVSTNANDTFNIITEAGDF